MHAADSKSFAYYYFSFTYFGKAPLVCTAISAEV